MFVMESYSECRVENTVLLAMLNRLSFMELKCRPNTSSLLNEAVLTRFFWRLGVFVPSALHYQQTVFYVDQERAECESLRFSLGNPI